MSNPWMGLSRANLGDRLNLLAIAGRAAKCATCRQCLVNPGDFAPLVASLCLALYKAGRQGDSETGGRGDGEKAAPAPAENQTEPAEKDNGHRPAWYREAERALQTNEQFWGSRSSIVRELCVEEPPTGQERVGIVTNAGNAVAVVGHPSLPWIADELAQVFVGANSREATLRSYLRELLRRSRLLMRHLAEARDDKERAEEIAARLRERENGRTEEAQS